MQVWLLDTERFIKVNGLKEVSNPMMFDSGNVPTADGLFSTEIFGTSSRERRENFAYIDLYKKFINPKIYISLLRLNRNFESIVYGTKKFSLKNGVLVEDDNGNTGIDWLYQIWDDIKFEKNDSSQRNERIDLLRNNKKDIIFSSKYVILPAFDRDVNIQSTDSNPKIPEINNLYASIIRNVKILKDATTMDFVLNSITGKIQDTIVEVYNLIKEKIQGKNGYIRRFLMGKSVDYCSRVVITAAPYVANSTEEQSVDFYHTGIPLSHVCSEFTPFMVFWLKNWFKNNMENVANSFLMIIDGKTVYVHLDNPSAYFNEEYIEKHLAQFVKTPSSRFDTIYVPIAQKDVEKYKLKTNLLPYFFEGKHISASDINTIPMDKDTPNVRRFLTWTDLLYMAAVDVTSDKHVWITRYPFLDYLGMYTTRITVLSTRKTTPMMIGQHLYKEYPVIELDKAGGNLDVLFRDTVNICPVYLKALCADHDGDQITSKSVFSQEGNAECERIMLSKSNLLTIEGSGIRVTGNEGTQTLYSMTKFM